MEGFFIFKINNNGKEENVVSFLPPNKVSELDGLHPLCIWGVATIAEDNKTIKSMINNSTFVEFMHEIIVKHAIEMPNMLEAGKQIGNGWVNIKDGREALEDDPNSNIIGSFKTENGIIQKEIYQKNPNYKLFNEKGLFSIHPYLEEILYSEINKIIFGNNITRLKVDQLKNGKLETQLIDTEDNDVKVLTFCNIGSIDKIPNTFYIGVIKIDLKTNELISFKPNNEFVTFLHSIIKEFGTENPMMISAGKSQQNGWIYIIDSRTPTPQGDVPPEDIIGAFEVKNGNLNKESYSKNDKHLLIGSNGLFGLDGYMSIILLDLMKQNVGKVNNKTESAVQKEKKGFFSKLFGK